MMHFKHFVPKRKLFEVFFSIGCFLFTGYIVFIQFQKYLDNRDSTVVFRKHFESDTDKLYPTFSLCLKGRVGNIFDYTSKEVKCKSPMCTNIMKQNTTHQCKDVSCTNEYYEVFSGKREDDFNFTLSKFDRALIDLRPLVKTFSSKLTNGKKINKIDKFQPTDKIPVFIRTYRDSYHVCYTKNEEYETGSNLRYEKFELDAEEMLSFGGYYDIHIFVHQKGRLLKKLGTPDFVVSNSLMKAERKRNEDGFTYEILMIIHSIEVLKRRPDAREPCNKTLYDEDTLWIKTSISHLGCVPNFMRYVTLGSNQNNNWPISYSCKRQNLKDFYANFTPDSNFKLTSDPYDPPCLEMESIVTSTATSIANTFDNFSPGAAGKLSKIRIIIDYKTENYKLAANYKKFGLLSLLSQIGGFVGMFLGYSLLRFPDLVVFGILWMKKPFEISKNTNPNNTSPDATVIM